MPHVKVDSAFVKVPLQQTLVKIQQAIAEGEVAVQKSATALAADPTNQQKQEIHSKNEMLLEKARHLKKGLEASVSISNMMCPQQVASLEFDFVE